MSYLSAVLFTVTLLLGLPAGADAAKPPLREVPEIADGIFTIVVANEIRRKCDDIGGRLIKGIAQIHRLKGRANDLGYSDDEIRALLDSKAEKALMVARGKSYMAGFGLDYDKPGDLCRLGRLEIENNSAIGALLRAK
ncbi:DUF5333 domain-containing protein [Antarcticimicrobium luteum]|uniref:DUF5333 domain-containing protein n=1 Tax=Antarcticimicrobium luteum TaxID=2547397 RepID=A0A4R5UVH0_9RHOB|nr:DUF5333 domain-containing protein [Antarcticimicrobium luteum]TDK43046.1 hypothetical protein E1832_17425 [Antarcticimicrobium luteum]